jgi:hypothetical protein
VQSSVVALIACTPILVAWLAVFAYRSRATRRRRREQAQWTRLIAGLSELDAELDRTWADEQERVRRYR